MALFRLMVVDDEDTLRDGLMRRIDWEKCGFTVVGLAENGRAGLELAERLCPDLIITDIRMPFMDGLEMSRRILMKQPGTKILVLSGFDDFEYAKQAVALGTTEYLLKPIGAQELSEALIRVRDRLSEELAEKRNLERLREHYRRSLPILREVLLTNLFTRRPSEHDFIEEECQRLSLDLSADCYIAMRVVGTRCSEHSPPPVTSGPLPSYELVPLSLRELVDAQLMQQKIRHHCVLDEEGVTVLALLDSETVLPTLLTTLDGVCLLGNRYFGLLVTVGVGLPVSSVYEIFRSAQGAREALDYRVMVGCGRVLFLRDIEPDPSARFAFDEQELQALISTIKTGRATDISMLTARLVHRLTDSRVPLQLYRFHIMAILTELIKLLQVYQLSFDAVHPETLLACTSPSELTDRLTETCVQLSALLHREHRTAVQTLAQSARSYIAAHFSDSTLSAERLSEYLHVSPSYFSTIFKRETGETFSSFLTRTRMERAAELLRTTTLKTYAIASEIGLSDPNYFSFVFKKHFGMSPSKYRESDGGL